MPETLFYARAADLLPGQRQPRPSVPEPTPRLSGVVVGTDGSYLGDRAVAWAARHAWLFGEVLHVYQSTGARAGAVAHGVTQAVHEYPTLSVVRHFIDEPDPLQALVAGSGEARTIVVGARGRHHPGLGLGHLVRPFVAMARCPVAVVKGHPDAIRERLATVSVAIGSTAYDTPLRRAVEFARRSGATLRVLHAAPTAAADIPNWAMATAARIVPDLAVDIAARVCLAHEIVAGAHDTNLLVIGRGHTRGHDESDGSPAKHSSTHRVRCWSPADDTDLARLRRVVTRA